MESFGSIVSVILSSVRTNERVSFVRRIKWFLYYLLMTMVISIFVGQMLFHGLWDFKELLNFNKGTIAFYVPLSVFWVGLAVFLTAKIKG